MLVPSRNEAYRVDIEGAGLVASEVVVAGALEALPADPAEQLSRRGACEESINRAVDHRADLSERKRRRVALIEP
jgi:hypothetical protein